MISLQRALQALSPLDIIVFDIEAQDIVKKKDLENFLPATILSKKAESFIFTGEMSERNPTYWNLSEGMKKEEVVDWDKKLAIELAGDLKFSVKHEELDNNSLVTTVASSVSMLLMNCKDLSKEQIKEAKCAKIFTAYGPLEVDLR